jgi:uncharacterized membrane protein
MARFFSFRSSFTLREREGYGIRGWAGKPTHPPLTDIPISCYVLAGGFYVACLVATRNGAGWAHDALAAATWVQVAGLAGSVLAVITGLLDWPAATPRTQVWRTVNAHAALMTIATLLALADVVLRFRGPQLGGTVPNVAALAILVAVLTGLGAWIGTDLVFEYGFRVEPSRDTPAWNPSSVDILAGGQADVDEEPAAGSPPGHGPADDALERLWQLDELRHEGVISQEDFERKKLDLLARI